MALARVIPAREGLTFPMPNGLDLPAEGIDVDIDDLFWRRRLLDGDVILRDGKEAPAAPAAAAEARKAKG
jgi:hypothetical protein